MAAFPSASSSQVPCGKYDVFISFRGPDVRLGFLSHLEKGLRQKNVDVYVDDRLQRGGEISASLVKAIEGSMIALVIFSKKYAFSRWCLKELVKIMDCKEANQQIVIPIFYRVHPSHVRDQKSTYAAAFTHLEQEFKDNGDILQIWRSVLKESANLSGYHLTKFSNESKVIDAIVEDVLKKLEENSPIVSNSLSIGLHQNFTGVESLMKIKPEEFRILGIWGMGGIGKTTLARAIFDKFKSKFESHCFLENVRETTKTDGLNSLRQHFVSKLLKRKDGIDMSEAMRRLQSKKVLIVVDDVDNPKQLKDLVGQHLLCLLGQGSRILVTSRDKHVLKSAGIDDKYIHEVDVLNFEASLELFSVNAFNQRQPKMEYQGLSEMTVDIAGGIPLALEVLGSHFHSRETEYWESELRKIKKCPHMQIQNILRISYDGLDAMDKEIFLDIAFFFVGERKSEIIRGLEACGFVAVSGIEHLIDKALIKCQDGYIEMHDLIREMAEQIVRENSETRSRLNDANELCGILNNNKGTDKIEGIMFDYFKKCLQLEADIFKKMKNLRLIKLLIPTKLSGLDSFPNELRYLHWYGYPLEYLPLGSCFENLVVLQMVKSKVKKLWDGKQDLANLIKINLCHSKQLRELPDFSMARKLKIVDLCGCENLRSVHQSILSLHTIVKMDVSYCKKLESLESQTHLNSLSKLRMDECYGLKTFCLSSKKLRHIDLPDSSVEILHFPKGKCTELRTLRVRGDRLSSLPIDGLCCLTNLEKFKVITFKKVIDTKEWRSLFDAWQNLTCLCLDGWSYLREIPDSIRSLTRLEELSLNDTSVETLPALNFLSSLKCIYIRSCKMLKSIQELPPSLEVLDVTKCTSLEILPAMNNLSSLKHIYRGGCNMLKSILGLPSSLQELNAKGHSSLETLPALNDISSLKRIDLGRCNMLKSILGHPPSLEVLDARDCTSLETLQALNDLSSLKRIDLSGCNMLQSILGLPPSLEVLDARECTSLETLPALNDLLNLKYIDLSGCKMLKSLLGLPPSLEILYAKECTSLETLTALNDLLSLICIYLRGCNMLKSILGLPPSLEVLDARECTSLETFPALNDLLNLKYIDLSGCKMLKSLFGLPPSLEILYAKECTSLKTLPALNDLLSLISIYLRGCNMLKSILGLPPFLEVLDTRDCTSLETLPALNDLSRLKRIDLSGCNMLKSMLGFPTSLEELCAKKCTSLETLLALNDVSSLKHIDLSGCNMLKSMLGFPPSLEQLDATDCSSLETLPALNDLSNMERIDLSGCNMLKSILGLPPSLEVLDARECTSLETLPSLNDLSSLKRICLSGCNMLKSILGLPPSLEQLNATDCSSLETLPAFNNLSSLKRIDLSGCNMLKSILGLPPSLKELDAGECTSLKKLPALNDLSRLKRIDLSGCNMLKSMLGLPPSLEELDAVDCSSLETLPALKDLSSLKRIDLSGCNMLKSMLGLPPSLEELDAADCSSLETLPVLKDLSSLKRIDLSGCNMLKSLLGLPPSLEELNARKCTSLKTLPALNDLSSLKRIDLSGCNMLKSILGLHPSLEVLYARECTSLETLSALNVLSRLKCIDLSGCKMLKSIHELPPFLDTLDAKECTSLERLPTLQKRKRVLDFCDEDQLPPTKQLNESSISQPTPPCLATTKSRKCQDNLI